MNWKTLMNGVNYRILSEGGAGEVTSIEYDSRKVKASGAFVAVSGGAFDGHDFFAKRG